MSETIIQSSEVIFDEKIRKLQWIVKIRYIASIVVWIMTVLTGYPSSFENGTFYVYTPVTLLFLVVNICIDVYIRKIKKRSFDDKMKINLNHSVVIQMLFDILLFTLVINSDGGIESHVVFMYVFVLIIVGFLADRLYAIIMVGIIVLLYSLLIFGEFFGIIGHNFIRGSGVTYFSRLDAVISEWSFVSVVIILIMYFFLYMSKESKAIEMELKKTLVELDTVKSQYEDITDNAFDLIQSIDTKGNFLYTNKKWQEKLGYSEKETKNIKVFNVINEHDLLNYQHVLEMLEITKESQSFRVGLISKTGVNILADGTISAKTDKKGKIISTREVLRDITETVKAEKALHEKNQELELLNETMVGRELKMIELQTENEKLKLQLSSKN